LGELRHAWRGRSRGARKELQWGRLTHGPACVKIRSIPTTLEVYKSFRCNNQLSE
jgi:hypothetical protein